MCREELEKNFKEKQKAEADQELEEDLMRSENEGYSIMYESEKKKEAEKLSAHR